MNTLEQKLRDAADEIERLRMCIATMPECDLQFKTEEEMTRWNYWKSQFNGLLYPPKKEMSDG